MGDAGRAGSLRRVLGACQEMSPGPASPGGGASDVGWLRGRVEGWSLGRPRAAGLYRPNPRRVLRTQALSAPYLACTLFPKPPAHPPFSSLHAPPASRPANLFFPIAAHACFSLHLFLTLSPALLKPLRPAFLLLPLLFPFLPSPTSRLISSLLGSSPFSPNLSSLSNLSPSGTFPLSCLMSPLRVGAGGGAHPRAEPLHPREKWEASRPPAM